MFSQSRMPYNEKATTTGAFRKRAPTVCFALMALTTVHPITGVTQAAPYCYDGTKSSLYGQYELAAFAVQREVSLGSLVSKIKFLSGLKWDELRKLFSVSRRSIHNWANGEPVNAVNEARIREVYKSLKSLEGRLPKENRLTLFNTLNSFSSITPFQLLQEGRFAEFNGFVHDKFNGVDFSSTELSSAAKAMRLPRSSVDFFDYEVSEPEPRTKAITGKYKRAKVTKS